MKIKYTLILTILILFMGLISVSIAQQRQLPTVVVTAPYELTGLKKHIEERIDEV